MNDGRHLALVARTATVCLAAAAAAGTCGKGARTQIYHTISGPTGGRLARARALDSGHQPCELPPPPDDNDPAVTVGTRILSAAHAHATAISSAFSISYVPTGAASSSPLAMRIRKHTHGRTQRQRDYACSWGFGRQRQRDVSD